jgi:putative flavoprotein involved in K+ transport
MPESIHTVVIGGGQAGLATSYHLTQRGLEHVVLEKSRVGESWRSQRWDSFTLVTPNWSLRLPGFPYQGPDPDGFLTRDQTVAYLEDYVALFDPPLRLGVEVTSVAMRPTSHGYRVETNQGTLDAANVVVATGSYQKPKFPPFSAKLPARLCQIHSVAYRNPKQLPPGAVLVVGSGQSGAQIAEELYLGGRQVYLSVGSSGRFPRRYRGKDIGWWLEQMGFLKRTVDALPSPAARFAPSGHLSGKDGGHTLNLHQFARDGVTLLGHVADVRQGQVYLAADLKENLAKADQAAAGIRKSADEYVERAGIQAPDDPQPELRDGYEAKEIRELDLGSAGIRTVLWATGYRFDFSWVEAPLLDDYGYPIQRRGVTDYPGLYFVGLHWLHTIASALLSGVGDDAAHVVEHIAKGQQR